MTRLAISSDNRQRSSVSQDEFALIRSSSSGDGESGVLGGVRPEVFAHFQLHPIQFGQEAAGGEMVVAGIGFGRAQLLDLPLEPLDALKRGHVFLFVLNHGAVTFTRLRSCRRSCRRVDVVVGESRSGQRVGAENAPHGLGGGFAAAARFAAVVVEAGRLQLHSHLYGLEGAAHLFGTGQEIEFDGRAGLANGFAIEFAQVSVSDFAFHKVAGLSASSPRQ